VLLGCGLRRAEIVSIRIEDLQLREEHWVIADLVGKGGHARTVPMPAWVKNVVDEWTSAAGISEGIIFRRINKEGKVWGLGPHFPNTPLTAWRPLASIPSNGHIDPAFLGNRNQLLNVELARGHFMVNSCEDIGSSAGLARDRDHFATACRKAK